jgi:hypothetical protein
VSDLSSWCFRHYDILHDFAAPIATIIAAGAAVFVTWRLGLRQVQIATQQAAIAEQQADTSLNRLRFDLFEQRYRVYQAAIRIIELSLDSRLSPAESGELQRSYITIGEAEFFFATEICDFVKKLGQDCTRYRRTSRMSADPEEDNRLLALRDTMPSRFAGALGFSQLNAAASNSKLPPIRQSQRAKSEPTTSANLLKGQKCG